jgi:hypothetical protein
MTKQILKPRFSRFQKLARIGLIGCVALSLALTALVPQTTHAQCFETDAGGLANLKQNGSTDCMVMTASRKESL